MTDRLFDISPYVIPTLEDRYGEMPFSILDTTTARWRARRRWWDSFELASGNGRAEGLTFAASGRPDHPVAARLSQLPTTSVFDPVLCEIIYRWWAPERAVVLDPFAGGSTRGAVAAILGLEYHGVDLSQQQIDVNEATSHRLQPSYSGPSPRWYENDSAHWQPNVAADLVMSCPPYGTLERYSTHPADLSTMKEGAFRDAYRRAIEHSVARLRDDRFAVFVVGNYREGNRLVDLVGMTIDAFGRAGADYYGDLILRNSTASAGIRASGTFDAGRKPISVHQHVCVFVKGSWRAAAAAASRYIAPDATDDQ